MAKKKLFASAMLLSFALGTSALVAAQDVKVGRPEPAQDNPSQAADEGAQVEIYQPRGAIVVPESSVVRPEDAGVRAHTNVRIFVPEGKPLSSVNPDNTFAETPQSLACVYGNGVSYSGCTPSGGSGLYPHGGWGAIVLVDAYDNPNAASDLATFSSHFGLPAATFHKVYANHSFGTLNGLTASCSGTPAGNTGWGLEEDLDIQYSHAMAPNAVIVLVEACSNSYNDLFYAENVAGMEAYKYGGGDVSNSWYGTEFSSEVSFDSNLYQYWQNVVYFASAGDSGWGADYPSSSPWIVSVGGTTINRASNGDYQSESCWSDSGGGASRFEVWQNPPSMSDGMGPWSGFQYPFAGEGPRQTPDIAADANPSSGAMVYDNYGYGGWVTVGGTSLASPLWAGIANISNNRLGQGPVGTPYYSTEENNLIYAQLFAETAYAGNFYDVTSGCNGSGHCAGAGYDQCTGVGTPRGRAGK